jgi:hypothetical protein
MKPSGGLRVPHAAQVLMIGHHAKAQQAFEFAGRHDVAQDAQHAGVHQGAPALLSSASMIMVSVVMWLFSLSRK